MATLCWWYAAIVLVTICSICAIVILTKLNYFDSPNANYIHRYRPRHGLFSNIIVPIQMSWALGRTHAIEFANEPVFQSLFEPFHVPPAYRTKLKKLGSNLNPGIRNAIAKKIRKYGIRAKRIDMTAAGITINQLQPIRNEWNVYVTKGPFTPNKNLMNEAASFFRSVFTKESLHVGVHLRSVQHFYDCVTSQEHVTGIIKCLLNIQRTAKLEVYLATNNTALHEMFLRFSAGMPYTIHSQDRTEMMTELSDDWNGKASKEAIYKEALIDAILLSMCDVIVGGTSNVVLYAAILNPKAALVIPEHLMNVKGK